MVLLNSQSSQRVAQTLTQMLKDRSVHDARYPADATIEHDNTKLSSFVDVTPELRVVFFGGSKLGSDSKALLAGAGESHVIFVVPEKGVIPAEVPNVGSFEVFEARELVFNVTHHHLVPKHEVLGSDEEADLLKRMSLKSKAQLPHIVRGDAVARYLGVKPGQVCKITRPSPTAGTYIMYRVCT
jgi:DNA-directed RNA polymerase subunit H (RpoH/RPB5)